MLNVNDLDPDEIRALAGLKIIGRERVLGVIQKFADAECAKLKKADETNILYRQQGRTQAFEDFIQAVHDAAELDARSDRV